IAAHPLGNLYYTGEQGREVVLRLTRRLITPSDKKLAPPPRAATLMVLRLLVNVVSTPKGAEVMISNSKNVSEVLDAMAEGTLAKDKSCRLAGATLAFNCSLTVKKSLSGEDQVTQIIA